MDEQNIARFVFRVSALSPLRNIGRVTVTEEFPSAPKNMIVRLCSECQISQSIENFYEEDVNNNITIVKDICQDCIAAKTLRGQKRKSPTRICNKCSQDKELDEYYHDARDKAEGRARICKKCRRKKSRK
jgi:hypothetical protein